MGALSRTDWVRKSKREERVIQVVLKVNFYCLWVEPGGICFVTETVFYTDVDVEFTVVVRFQRVEET